MPSLFTALKQYLRDAAPGGVLSPEAEPIAQYGRKVRGNVQGLLDDPVAFAKSAVLDVVPNRDESNAVLSQLMGRPYDQNMSRAYLDKMIDMGGLLGSIKVFHGSPHKFDKFDLSKMGTGEGAQMYGHGGYVAEAPDVAQNYIPRDAKFENNVMRMYKQAERAGDYDAMAVYERYLLHDTPSAVEQYVKEAASGGGDARKLQQANEAAKRVWERQQAGYLYEANLRWPDAAREAADPMGPQHFMDWDKPIGQQPKAIQQAIKSTRSMLPANAADDLGGDFSLLYGKNVTPGEFLGTMEALGGRPDFGEKLLKQQGVPGIRYLDERSRGMAQALPAKGKGTANYVVFDDALIEILKRNGVAVK